MGGFGSIDDLLQKNNSQDPGASSGSLNIDPNSAEAILQKKMGQVGLKEREKETIKKAQQIGVPHIDLDRFPIGHSALRQVPLEEAKKLQAVCFFYSPDQLRVGAVDPISQEVEDLVYQLEERTHAKVVLYIISEHSLEHVFDLYKTLPNVVPVTKDITIKEEDLQKVQVEVQDFGALQDQLKKATTTDSLVVTLGASLQLGASDVHIEAEEEQIVVRFRLDGILHDAATLPKSVYKKLISRIKLVSSLKLNITDKPQDGRFTIKLSSGDVDVRVSTVPTVYGESVVMRLLRQSRKGLSLDGLGLSDRDFKLLKSQIERPNGMVITTGPTGSGKTTTLYACMTLLNQPDVKILTLEDPVEYKMQGVNQSQIDKTKGFTFAKGLRAMLRQDPDIAMVGEIRDLETADIAIQAALTGHLMLSTIHTNSAAGAIPRFLSMGVKPFLLAPALNAIIGQRLVRRLNDNAKTRATLTPEQEKKVRTLIESMPDDVRQEAESKPFEFYTAPEYLDNGEMGYKGRIGIYEIFEVTTEIEQMILAGHVSEFDIEQAARAQGMRTMAQDGILKALQGITSIDEVFRVIE